MRNPLILSTVLALSVLASVVPRPAAAQERENTLSARRLALNFSSGYLGFKTYGDGAKPWSGVDLATALSYNLDAWTAVALIEHGIPVNSDGHRTLARAYVNLRTSTLGAWTMYVGAGGLAMGERAPRDWTGPEAHLTASYKFAPRFFLSGTYSHAFSVRETAQPDFDFYRVVLVGKVAP